MTIRQIACAFNEPETVQKIVSVYQAVFAAAPWHEAKICPVCQMNFGLDNEDDYCSCQGGKILLVDYWPTAKVTSDFYTEMQKPKAECVVYTEGSALYGFAWGYGVSNSIHLDEHLEAPGLHGLIQEENYFYLDEVAVLPERQANGIGRSLVEGLVAGKEKCLLRTKHGSHMERLIIRLGGTIVQHISRGRVIMTL